VVPERLRQLDAHGFSLAELVATLALIAVLCLVASPSLVGYWRTSTLRAGAEELARAIGHARQLAIVLNTRVCVAVGDGQVRFEAPGTGACSGVPVAAAASIRLSGGLVVTATGPGVVFTSLGAATPAGGYTVADPVNGLARRVVVGVSGRVSIQ
jgi:prepilin-type N-terminal cleavage/methylation domain-containing protein